MPLVSFFRAFFKFLFHRLAVKLYYQIFRLKKADLIKNSPEKILREQSAIFFVFILSLLLIFINIFGQSKAHALENKISHTVMANLVVRDFSNIEEELIEEGADLDSLLIMNKDKYLDSSLTLNKEIALDVSEEENLDELVFNEEQDIVMKPKAITTEINIETDSPQTRRGIVEYTVQSGDTVSSIARKFGISVNTVLWSNNLSSFSLIRPGNKLTILPYSGVIHTVKSGDTLAGIARKYGVTQTTIRNSNSLGSVLRIGEKLTIPGGKKTIVRTSTPSYTGVSVVKDLVKSSPSASVSNKMAWPTEGHRITQYFSWRHAGLDIANKTGTPLYAADAGTVTYSGWSRGYGYNVLIDHGGGKKTRYAHASKLFVSKGEQVDKGEHIAAMGSTGWSTGPHIHFEVIINGKKYNPLNYIK